MSAQNTSATVPILALSNTPNPVSEGDISGSLLPRCTDNDRHLASVTGKALETKNVVPSGTHTAMTAKGGRVNSYSSLCNLTAPDTLTEDNLNGPMPIDGIPEYLCSIVDHVKKMRKPISSCSPGVAEKLLFHSLETPGSSYEDCQDSNNGAPEELYILMHLQSSAKHNTTGSTKHVNISGIDPPLPVDDIASTGAFSVVVANEKSPDHSLHTAQQPYSRAAPPTDSQPLSESAIDDGVPKDIDLDRDMPKSELTDYDIAKGLIPTDLPIMRLEGIQEACNREKVIERLRGICFDRPEPDPSKVNVVSKSETLDNVGDAAPEYMVQDGIPGLTLSSENGRLCTIEHMCKFLEA
ncbi:hypothetical protein F5146DRAFT_1168663 [Armillaria mellea]|nr:hypothetical protein F5146DRAFT_1168663 [Armillaria mellea]